MRHAIAISLAALLLAAAARASEGAPTKRAPGSSVPHSGTETRSAGAHFGIRGDTDGSFDRGLRSVGEDTLWIFDADFEDLTGDNAGWTSLDMSGTLATVNYWHKDTIRVNGFEWLGDSTWWCGTYNDCWLQPRGYGNDWLCILERAFPEVAEFSDPGDVLVLEYDQRYAMENTYDYGYTDVSADGGETWATFLIVDNPGFAGHPGSSQDWDSEQIVGGGHITLDLSDYAGQAISIRFRFDSDPAYSSQDQYDNPPHHSVQDGAWQLDNFTLLVNDTVRWYDDCEAPGDNGWVHENIPGSGQTGVVFQRMFEPDILRTEWYWRWCRPQGWWMAALDSETGRMVDGQNSWLLSPPIDISEADGLVGQWWIWADLGGDWAHDYYDIYLSTVEDSACLFEHDSFVDALMQWPDIGPGLIRQADDWDNWEWGNWLAICWRLWNDEPAEPGTPHMTGVMLDRQRVGVPVGGAPTWWDYDVWNRFHDTFDMAEALTDTAWIRISDWDGIVSASLVVSSDAGATWQSSPLHRIYPESDYWKAAPPTGHIAPATEIRYYFESTDSVGNVRTHPAGAPDAYYEFSILPIHGSVSEPSLLLVDKHGRLIRGEDNAFRHTSEYYFREALDILGFEYDVYDVEVPSGSTDQSNGPDSSAYKYYDTQIWFTNDFSAYTIKPFDQANIIAWLGQAAEGKERNLLLTGNDIGEEVVGYEEDPLGFYSTWLASEYLVGDVAGVSDSLLLLQDAGGGFDFMTYDERRCALRLLEWGYG